MASNSNRDGSHIGKRVEVTQTRSGSGRGPRVAKTLHALGLGRSGKVRTMTLNEPLIGMLTKVGHLVSIKPLG